MKMHIGRLLIISGIALIAVGLIVLFAENKPGLIHWFGHLPGDIRIEKKNTRIFFPFVSMLLLSVILTVIINLVKKMF